MQRKYIRVSYALRPFNGQIKVAVLSIFADSNYLSASMEHSVERRIANKLGLQQSDVSVIDYEFIGEDIMFIL